ncbi:citrate lyase acyl carrier protein [Jeotgalibaca caeni]|uniref:citrate lyase acyl carrier protein n=1 Tax=Jeotgalibaca caeni TaxID=3028623 RepID=UPI00237E812C|nr:citrate lyase acyl carrier protein [Jeotgalibaca caeni]MDE1547993.1 citrate lyase acyl carrier protein [Jeotgalibaca caeni]
MIIERQAIAGTLESSDLQIIIDKNDGHGIEIDLQSSVEKQFGRRIREVLMETLKNLKVEDAKVVVVDKGALDCTIIARTMAAVHRAAGITSNYNWEGFEEWNV